MKQKGIRDSDEYRPGCPECEEKRDGYGANSGCTKHWLEGDGQRMSIPIVVSERNPHLLDLLLGRDSDG